VIEYLLIAVISLMIFLCLTNFIEQLAGTTARQVPLSLSRTRQASPLKGEPK
jgi:hypothetical protein